MGGFAFRIFPFASKEYEEAFILRNNVPRASLGMLFDRETDTVGEERGWHFGLFDENGRIVATLYAEPKSAEQVQIRYVAVCGNLQGAGLGRMLIQNCEKEVSKLGFKEFTLNARDYAVQFYRKLGYAPVGEWFVIAGIDHIRMTRRQPADA